MKVIEFAVYILLPSLKQYQKNNTSSERSLQFECITEVKHSELALLVFCNICNKLKQYIVIFIAGLFGITRLKKLINHQTHQ